MIGRIISHYRILDKLGSGGMGEVYRARDEHLERDVAVKVLPPGTLSDESARKRFRREALSLSQLNYPNIETVHDFDTQGSVDFLVMELISGTTLSTRLCAGPLPEKEIARLGVQPAEGLAAAHDKGIIHRDLKPANIFVCRDGQVRILDFGIAKLTRPEVTMDRHAEATASGPTTGAGRGGRHRRLHLAGALETGPYLGRISKIQNRCSNFGFWRYGPPGVLLGRGTLLPA